MAVNKVVYAGETLIDLTGDDVTPNDVKSGVTFHQANGELATGTYVPGGSFDPTDATNKMTAAGFSYGRQPDTDVGQFSVALGLYAEASGKISHAEGYLTTASGQASHAEGLGTTASAQCSHAEGNETTASGQASHAEGYNTIASGNYQHVQGKYNVEDTSKAFIIGNGTLNSARSNALTVDWDGNVDVSGNIKAAGLTDGTTTKTMTEILAGGGTEKEIVEFSNSTVSNFTRVFDDINSNESNFHKYDLYYDNGASSDNIHLITCRKTLGIDEIAFIGCGNAYTGNPESCYIRLTKVGASWQMNKTTTQLQPKLTAGNGITITNNQIASKIPAPPTADGNYVLKCSIVGGVATYNWVAE